MMRAARRRRPRPGPAALVLAVCAASLLSTAAAADLLVTRDGSVIQTRGAWRVQGKLVIFELPDGQLASLQLGAVDLEASRAATEKSKAPPQKAPQPPAQERTAVMVITDADVRQAQAEREGTEPPADEEAASTDASPAAQRLVVSSWDDSSGPDGLVITGELTNQSPDVAANISLGILLYDREGEVLATVLADVTSQVLQPGQRARFRADAEGIFEFSALRFEAESLGLATSAAEEGPDGDEG